MTEHLTADTLIDYLHRELAPDRDASVLAHVEDCAQCRSALDAEAALTEELRAAARTEELDVPLGFAAAIMARIEAEESRSPLEQFGRWLRPAVLWPAAGLAAMAALFLFSPLGHHVPEANQTLPVSYLLEEHASHAQENPLADRSANQIMTAAFERSGPPATVLPPVVHLIESASLVDDGPR